MKDGRQAFFLFLPDGEDPDTIVRKEGAAGFDARLAQAMPLSAFFFQELSKDVNLGSLDGKARLAERCKPLLAQIPDGAFGDLMRQRLTELTGVGARASAPETHVPVQRARSRAGHATAPKRSLVRSAIALLLQQPALALTLTTPHRFGALRQPGIELLVELLDLIRTRPSITTGSLLEHFADRDELAALQKLSVEEFLPGDDQATPDFLGTLRQLDLQYLEQRRSELSERLAQAGFAGMTDAEKGEYRAIPQQIAALKAELRQPHAAGP
jgi:DNA primase